MSRACCGRWRRTSNLAAGGTRNGQQPWERVASCRIWSPAISGPGVVCVSSPEMIDPSRVWVIFALFLSCRHEVAAVPGEPSDRPHRGGHSSAAAAVHVPAVRLILSFPGLLLRWSQEHVDCVLASPLSLETNPRSLLLDGVQQLGYPVQATAVCRRYSSGDT